MNPKINKAIEEIERTKAKIAELQALLPELERRRVDMENTEIIRLVRSASIAPADLPEFLEAIKAINAAPPEPAAAYTPARNVLDAGNGEKNKTTLTEEDNTDA